MAIGFWASRKVKTEDDFFLGGRKFGKGLADHALAVHRHAQRDGGAGGRRDGPRRARGHLVPVDVVVLDAVLLADRPGDAHGSA